jgi:hypothetical protein
VDGLAGAAVGAVGDERTGVSSLSRLHRTTKTAKRGTVSSQSGHSRCGIWSHWLSLKVLLGEHVLYGCTVPVGGGLVHGGWCLVVLGGGEVVFYLGRLNPFPLRPNPLGAD